MNILILNGPNLNLTGKRRVSIYGSRSMEQIVLNLQMQYHEVQFTYRQSNHEGDLIDWLQAAGLPDDENDNTLPYQAVILNAGGYSHTSIALRDTVEWLREQNLTVVETHLSHIQERETFRRHSLLTEVCNTTIYGLNAYEKAVDYILSAGQHN